MKTLLYTSIVLIICMLNENPIIIKLDAIPELFTIDKLGNCYIYDNNHLKKYSAPGKLIAQYSLLESGKLHFIDASDPMDLLLFYKDFNQLAFLDNKLNPIGSPFRFDDLNLTNVSAVCKSKQLAVWLYDDYENKLIQYGFNPKGIIHTINLANYGKQTTQINFILEHGNELYLNQKGVAVWVFDIFGSKLKKLDIQIDDEFQVKGNSIIYNNGNFILKRNILNGTTDTLKLTGFTKFDGAKLVAGSVYILKRDSIIINKIESTSND